MVKLSLGLYNVSNSTVISGATTGGGEKATVKSATLAGITNQPKI
jgi:hypothetical protein